MHGGCGWKLTIIFIIQFPFLDPPAPSALLDALAMLYYLGALDADGKITKLGKQMSDFPLEPALAKMVRCICICVS